MENFIFPLGILLLIAALTEAVIEVIKSFIPSKLVVREEALKFLSVVVATALTVSLKVTLFKTTGISYYVGAILAGLICSRGSNFIHQLSDVLRAIKFKK